MKEKMVQKIQKMLALAANNPESEEAKTASKMAGELMAKYNIAMFDIEEKQAVEIKSEEFKTHIYSDMLWHGRLAMVVAKTFDCDVLRITVGPNRTDFVWRFYGYASDIAIASWYFKYLRLKIGKMGSDRFKKKREKRDYCEGVVLAVEENLERTFSARKQNLDEKTSALVVTKKHNVDNFVSKKHPDVRKAKSQAKSNLENVAKGYRDGKNVSLSKPISGNKQTNGIVPV